MNIPEHLLYTTEHLWVAPAEDGNWHVGITDHAQELLGDIVYLQPPAIDDRVSRGAPCGLVESVKTGSDLHAPVDGVVIAVNEAVIDAPERINEAPYDSWIFQLRPLDEGQRDSLLDAVRYREFLG